MATAWPAPPLMGDRTAHEHDRAFPPVLPVSMRRYDVILIHPPAVFDFRERPIFFGPISDVIPSTPLFEMYPVGFLTLAAHLHAARLRVRVVNLALLMLRKPRLDVERFLARLDAALFGIDLHWLPHAHGSIELARLLRRLHADTPIVMGGLSATYFHEELAADPAVDFVLRGSATEDALLELLRRLRSDRTVADVPGLTWKDDGAVRVNPDHAPPPVLDALEYDLGLMVRGVVTRAAFWESVPFLKWWKHPITAIFTVRGCARRCATCGAGRDAFPRYVPGRHPFLRSPAAIARQARHLARLTRAPIFLVGDLLDGGDDYARATIDALALARVRNVLTFEFFAPPPAWFIAHAAARLPAFAVEISPESHDPAIRARFGKAEYENCELEESIERLLATSCREVALFFMIGLPGQTYESALATIEYTAELFERFDRRLTAFVSPCGPFLDPGSPAFEEPEAHGYRLFARTLAEHHALWKNRDWEHILAYETRWMTRQRIVEATYDAAERLNRLKAETGRIPPELAASVQKRIERAHELRRTLDGLGDHPLDPATHRALIEDIRSFSAATMNDKTELFPLRALATNFRWSGVLRTLLGI